MAALSAAAWRMRLSDIAEVRSMAMAASPRMPVIISATITIVWPRCRLLLTSVLRHHRGAGFQEEHRREDAPDRRRERRVAHHDGDRDLEASLLREVGQLRAACGLAGLDAAARRA